MIEDGVPTGISNQLISQVDICPTILARLGVVPSWTMDGIDFLTTTRSTVLTTWRPPKAGTGSAGTNFPTAFFHSLTDGTFKLIHNLETPVGSPPQITFSEQWELYDLSVDVDPGENTNLYGNPAYATQQAALQAQLQAIEATLPPNS